MSIFYTRQAGCKPPKWSRAPLCVKQQVLFGPDEYISYSNGGMIVAGRLLEVVTAVNVGIVWTVSGLFCGWLLPQTESRTATDLSKICSRNSHIYSFPPTVAASRGASPPMSPADRTRSCPTTTHNRGPSPQRRGRWSSRSRTRGRRAADSTPGRTY